jgi:hypothetical protein
MATEYSIVIPVLALENNPYLDDLLKGLERQTYLPNAVHLVVGDRRQGRAINYGVSKVNSFYVGTLDDDSFVDDDQLFEKLCRAMNEDPSIGMAGAACEIPDWATDFQKRAMLEIPRRVFPTQKASVDSDMVQHPCLLMEKKFFDDIGGEDEELIRGLDPVLRKKVRDKGRRVVVVANTWVYHLLPADLKKLCRMYYRNGKGSGYAQRFFPDRVLELTDGEDGGSFVEKRSFVYRLGRRATSWLLSLVLGQWIKMATDLSYGLGVVMESLLPSSQQSAPEIEKISEEEMTDFSYPILVHRVHLKPETTT